MTTAREAMEVLRLALLEEAEIRLGAAYRPGVEGEIQAQARGEGYALQEVAEQIARMQAEGFSDADPVAAVAAEKARADAYEALLLEHGRLAVEVVLKGPNPRAEARMAEIMLPYVVMAMPTEGGSVQ